MSENKMGGGSFKYKGDMAGTKGEAGEVEESKSHVGHYKTYSKESGMGYHSASGPKLEHSKKHHSKEHHKAHGGKHHMKHK